MWAGGRAGVWAGGSFFEAISAGVQFCSVGFLPEEILIV